MNEFKIRLIAPPPAPFHSDGSLNLDPVEQQAQLLVDTTADGAFVAGSTGEGQSLSTDERMQLAERWMNVTTGTDLEIMIQVGHNSQPDAIALAEHAQRIGADSCSASSPCYFKPANVDALIDFLAPVAAAAGDLPFYFYEIPPFTNVNLPMVELLEKGKLRIPNLVGLKYSNPDLMQLQQCVRLNGGEFEVLFGSDPQLLSAVLYGACGAVGSTYNHAALLYREMLRAFERGELDAAREAQGRSVDMIAIMARHSFMSALKTVLRTKGIELGPVRAPLVNLTADQQRELLRDLEQADLLDFSSSQSSAAQGMSSAADD
jgi:N-acetylneuraminate lyase